MPSCGVRVGASSEYNSVERSDAYTSYLSCVVSCLNESAVSSREKCGLLRVVSTQSFYANFACPPSPVAANLFFTAIPLLRAVFITLGSLDNHCHGTRITPVVG